VTLVRFSLSRATAKAADAAAEMLERLRLPVSKEIDPLDPAGFARIVTRLQHDLSGATAVDEADALRRAIEALDVDWTRLSPAGRDAVVRAAREAVAGVADHAMPRVRQLFEARGPAIYGDSRSSASRRFGFDLSQTLSLRDLAAERFVRESNVHFVRDTYGRRADELSSTAREIVARGLEEGRGSSEIAGDLADALGDRVMRGDSYWQTVAMQFANSARTYSQVNAMRDAGIQTLVFEAVLDEVTTDICRFMHGQVFSVPVAGAQLDRLASLENPDDVVNVAPWYREGTDPDGNRVIYFERADGSQTTVAQIERSGRGTSDDTGEYSNAMSAAEMQASSVPYPPLHAKCRSNVVPQ